MPTIPWKSTDRQTPSPGTGPTDSAVVVQVSQLELLRLRSVPGFVLAALRLRREVLRSDGALGVSLIAQPLQKTFWTLSAWTDTGAIGDFTRSEAHRAVMVNYRTKMRGSHFHTWWPDEAGQRPAWPDAKARLRQSQIDESG